MKIDLDDLIACKKCGCVFDYTKAGENKGNYRDSWQGKCPLCKEEFNQWEVS